MHFNLVLAFFSQNPNLWLRARELYGPDLHVFVHTESKDGLLWAVRGTGVGPPLPSMQLGLSLRAHQLSLPEAAGNSVVSI